MIDFNSIENCVIYLSSTIIPIIRNLSCKYTMLLAICCGNNELYIHITKYNKENGISFYYKMIDLAEDVRIGASFECEPIELFYDILKSFLQGYCLENLDKGYYVRIGSLVEDDLDADMQEDYEDCEYVEEDEDDDFDDISPLTDEEQSELDAYLSDMADYNQDVDDDDLPF